MSHIEDIKGWRTNNLPMAADWNTGGYLPDYHVKKVMDGGRFIPSAKFFATSNMINGTNPNYVNMKAPWGSGALKYLNDNGLPVILRADNIPNTFTDQYNPYRLPLVIENLPKSPLVWTVTSSGTLSDEKIVDMFSDPALWAYMGKDWATCPQTVNWQAALPNPAFVMMSDNNESHYDKPGYYITPSSTFGRATTLNQFYWSPTPVVKSIRALAYASGTPNAVDLISTYWNNRINHYTTFKNAFNNNLTSGWKDKFYLDAYHDGTMGPLLDINNRVYYGQYDPQLFYYDGGGASIYSTQGTYSDFTGSQFFDVYNISVGYERIEQVRPNIHREVFVNISDNAAIIGNQQGKHEIISPDLYSAYMQWLMWVSRRDGGGPLLMRRWCYSTIKPTDLVFASGTQAYLDSVGRPELKTATYDDYLDSTIKAVNLVCENPILRDFWLKGKTVVTGTHPSTEIRYNTVDPPVEYPYHEDADNRWKLLECDINTPRSQMVQAPGPNYRGSLKSTISIKVWGTAIAHPNGTYLIHMWTPCKLTTPTTFALPNVGNFTVSPQLGTNYYVVVNPTTIMTLDQYADFIAKVNVTINWTPSPSSWAKQSITIAGDDVNITQEIPNTQNSFVIPLTKNKTYVATVTAFDTNASSVSMTFTVGNKVPAPPSQIYIA